MANSTKPLTNTEVSQAKPKAKEYNLADGQGLLLRVKPNGSKLWLFNYFKPHTSKRSNIGIGKYPAVTLQGARKTRDHYLTLLAEDIDPKLQREALDKKHRVAHLNTFEAAARKWLKLKEGVISASYQERIQDALELYIFPAMGSTPIHKVSAPDTIEILQPLADKGILETVKKLCRWLNEIMTYSVNAGLVHSNPLAGIGKAFQNPQSESMPTISPDEMPRFVRTLMSAGVTAVTLRLILLQLHTMVRPGEAAGARWAEFDLDNRIWEISLLRMKKRRVHKIPLTTQVISVLNKMKEISGGKEFVFPSFIRPKSHIHKETANKALRRMGFQGELVAHGMRSIASTLLNEQGFDPELIEVCLSHMNKDRIRAAYNKAEYIERRRTMLQWWSDFIEASATGSATVTGTKHLRAVR